MEKVKSWERKMLQRPVCLNEGQHTSEMIKGIGIYRY